MFHTPRSMVSTRRTAKKDDEEHQEGKLSIPKTPTLPPGNEEDVRRNKTFPRRNQNEGSVVKSEPPLALFPPMPSTSRQAPVQKSRRSSSSSVLAQKRRLELEAAEARAKIELDLINKRLAADIAELEDGNSSQSDGKEVQVRKCLHGAAKEAVTALLISATTPALVLSTLELQFGNPDIIISRIMLDIKKLQPMSLEYHKDIVTFSVKVRNYVAAVQAIGRDEYLQGTSLIAVILSKLPTVLISKWADYSYTLINDNKKPILLILSEFLNEEAVKISKTSVNIANYNVSDYKRKLNERTHTVLVQNNAVEDKCRFCHTSIHNLIDCKKFKKALRKVRWQFVKRSGLCYKCLVSRHKRESCPAPVCDINNCGQSHHKLLHYENALSECSPIHNTDANEQGDSLPSRSETITHILTNNNKVLLKTVPVCVHGLNGVVNTVALLDDGSTVSIISDRLLKTLGVRGYKQTMRVRGAWDGSELQCNSEIVNLNVSNKDGMLFTLQARSTDGLNLPTQFVSLDELMCSEPIKNIKHLLCDGQCKPEILIGQDNYHLLMPLEITYNKPTGPYVTRTPLGWCVHGRISPALEDRSHHTTLFMTDQNVDEEQLESSRILLQLQEDVRRSFTIDALGITPTPSSPRQNSENSKAIDHLERTSFLMDGRWYVGLPWKDRTCKMPESYSNAYNRLKGVQKKCKANQNYAARYSERIDHLLRNNYAHEIQNNKEMLNTWYLPHFGVDNPNKKKLRLVFDAAAKSNGFSLNDYLITGPDLLISLYGIMMRFRENRIAVTGDIRDMFLRIKIIPEDQNALRFLWQTVENKISTYSMSSLIFGANGEQFVAQFIKNKNANRYESSKPEAVKAIYKQFYMDDYIDSFEDATSAIRLIEGISYIHRHGGFEITNWTSNSEEVLNSLPKETLCPSAVKFKIGQDVGERTLGLIWYPNEDELGFDVSFKRIPENIINGLKRPTKREMLQLLMSIFDVYGFLSPFTIKAKILLQQMWKSNIDWDDEIPDIICTKWFNWINLLKCIHNIRLPRCYHASIRESETALDSTNALNAPNSSEPILRVPATDNNNGSFCERASQAMTQRTSSYTDLQLHIFCDASTQAMCAVAYWRWINNRGKIQIAFISSKCRVAPVKQMSVPRLELQAALLAARLSHSIIKEHKTVPSQKHFWCDSSTVLHWIRNHARDYKPFVAHRLGEIDELSLIKEWHYVPTKMNVADIATRDTCELSVLHKEWLYGPEFLYEGKESWPKDIPAYEVSGDVLERVSFVCQVISPPVPNPEKFSSWLRLLKTTCIVLSFIDKCKKLTGEVNGDTMRRAERLLIVYSQSQSFADDLKHLKNKRTVERTSKLLTLSPFIDEHGVLRVGGRIDAAPAILPETKHPVILDGRNYIAKLLVKYYHVQAAHGNRESVVNNLKQKYWIIRMRPTVIQVTSACMFCKIKKSKPQPPRMGDLPTARMAHHQRPFTFCGVDLFGSMEVTVGRHKEKRYGVLFTCMTVRAIHIEIVTKLTTDVFIMSLRRMAARRGWPQYLYSDNGTNLRGADNELKKSVMELDEGVLKRETSNYGTTWTFSPPASPHWGGAWERLIRSVKQSLKVVLKERAPRDEVLSTLMTEVEQIVNGRPLTHVSVEPGSDESLTPNHFLLNSSSNLPCIGTFDESDTYLRKQWRTSQRLADLFWKRWVREVLPDMRPTTKWHTESRPLQVGDLVLIVDPGSPRGMWPRGRIQRVMPGNDGRVRVVDIETRAGVLRRSAARVVLVPTGNEC